MITVRMPGCRFVVDLERDCAEFRPARIDPDQEGPSVDRGFERVISSIAVRPAKCSVMALFRRTKVPFVEAALPPALIHDDSHPHISSPSLSLGS